MIKVAYLRAFVPAGKQPAVDRHVGGGATRMQADERFIWHESLRDDAFTAEWAGVRMVCPRYPRLRMLEGVVAFAAAHPSMGSLLVSESRLARAAAELEDLRRERSQRSHILTSPWHVPLRWFSLFLPEERELIEDGEVVSIRYRTGVAEATGRVDQALGIVEGAGFGEEIVDEIRDLAGWLRSFPASGMAELDYGSVAGMFTPQELVLDESAAEVWSSLRALERGNFEEAGMFYASVASRWARPQALAYVN